MKATCENCGSYTCSMAGKMQGAECVCTEWQPGKGEVEKMATLSIKMIDGSRYDTDEPLEMRNDNWITIHAMTRQGAHKRVRLNPKHMVSITEETDDRI